MSNFKHNPISYQTNNVNKIDHNQSEDLPSIGAVVLTSAIHVIMWLPHSGFMAPISNLQKNISSKFPIYFLFFK